MWCYQGYLTLINKYQDNSMLMVITPNVAVSSISDRGGMSKSTQYQTLIS